MHQIVQLASGLSDLASLPSRALKLVIENVVTQQVAALLGKFLTTLGLAIDFNILLILAFILVAVIALWIINWIISLFNGSSVDPCNPCNIVDCQDDCCDDDFFCCEPCLLG